jgi:3-hydroxypropanoate dehydrogenase
MAETTLNDAGLDLIFREARTANAWTPRQVSSALMQAVYDLTKMGPTSANCSPARFVFVTSAEAKARLKPHVSAGNLEKTMTAPVTVIVAHDLDFAERLPELFPHAPGAKSWFAAPEAAAATAFRNGSLQGAYFILAARSLGLDCGPMSGFDNAGVDAEFFPEGRVKSNFLCNIGYADPSGTLARSPRLDFEDACEIL